MSNETATNQTVDTVSTEIEILEKEIIHQYLSREKIIHKRKFKLKALKDGLDTFIDKFLWTGDNFKIKAGIPEHKVTIKGIKNAFSLYEYKFDGKLGRDETADIEVIWELDNSSLKASQYFSTTIEEPTKILKMNLKLLPSFGVKKVVCEVSKTMAAKRPAESKEVDLDNNGEYLWTINNPGIFNCYEINWNF